MSSSWLVTGGSGFIGTNLVELALARGVSVCNFDTMPPRMLQHVPIWRRVDILDRAALHAAVSEVAPDVVVHLAARTDLAGRTIDDYVTNTAGVTNLLDAVGAVPSVRRTIFASSMLVCRLGYRPKGPVDYAPSTPYGESKVFGERLVRARADDIGSFAIVRPTSIWGPWFGRPYRDFFDLVARGLYLHPRGAATARSYGFVGNAVAQIEALIDADDAALGDRLFYLADYEPVEIGAWAAMIASAMRRPPPRSAPLALFRVAAAAGDALRQLGWRNPPMTRFRLDNMLTDAVLDTGPMQSLLPSLPHDIETGVRLTVEWLADRAAATSAGRRG